MCLDRGPPPVNPPKAAWSRTSRAASGPGWATGSVRHRLWSIMSEAGKGRRPGRPADCRVSHDGFRMPVITSFSIRTEAGIRMSPSKETARSGAHGSAGSVGIWPVRTVQHGAKMTAPGFSNSPDPLPDLVQISNAVRRTSHTILPIPLCHSFEYPGVGSAGSGEHRSQSYHASATERIAACGF